MNQTPANQYNMQCKQKQTLYTTKQVYCLLTEKVHHARHVLPLLVRDQTFVFSDVIQTWQHKTKTTWHESIFQTSLRVRIEPAGYLLTYLKHDRCRQFKSSFFRGSVMEVTSVDNTYTPRIVAWKRNVLEGERKHQWCKTLSDRVHLKNITHQRMVTCNKSSVVIGQIYSSSRRYITCQNKRMVCQRWENRLSRQGLLMEKIWVGGGLTITSSYLIMMLVLLWNKRSWFQWNLQITRTVGCFFNVSECSNTDELKWFRWTCI